MPSSSRVVAPLVRFLLGKLFVVDGEQEGEAHNFSFFSDKTKLPLEPAAAAPSASGQRRCYHPLFIPEPSPPRTGSCDFSSHSSSPTPKTRARLHRTSDVRHTAAFGVAATTASRLSLATT
ncbi:hypothetical protein DEO72_LG10g1765 [Vigna unguiculata]|uniref:Uncharacterized protein n=1 Tax=Vigna unguiculata TaxID=3917 RepID=A0A4D6NEC3_VIGUN|nr:hypothetical protein DEO72_LG10g1765 [Vigna unguiculata]